MGRIIVSENVSLDGVVQDPTGEEGFKHGGWFLQMGDKDREEWAKVELDEALGAEALLLGRRSDEWFAVRWLSRSGAWADRPRHQGGDHSALPAFATVLGAAKSNTILASNCVPRAPGFSHV